MYNNNNNTISSTGPQVTKQMYNNNTPLTINYHR